MHNAEFHLRIVGDARLAVHATSAFPAWLWSIDGTRVLLSNPAAAQVFAAANPASLSSKTFGPADRYRRQVAQLAARLPSNGALRLERLRGFGASLGMLMTCGCARLEFADGSHGILVAAAQSVGRAMPLVERLQRLVAGLVKNRSGKVKRAEQRSCRIAGADENAVACKRSHRHLDPLDQSL